MSYDRYAADTAEKTIRAVFPQCAAAAWKGSEGAQGDCVTVNHGVVTIVLHKKDGLWWAEASGRADFEPIAQFASSALEAARKLSTDLRA